LIDVEVNGKHYDEMHTDGGTVTQVFFHAGIMNLGAAAHASGRTQRDGYRGTMYVIRNGKLGAEPGQTERSIGKISRRALATLVKYAASYDINRIYGSAVYANLQFKYTAIPDDYKSKAVEICAYAIMSNHYHVVLHLDKEQADNWNQNEVIERWHTLPHSLF